MRARIKNLEDMPEREKCCAATIEAMRIYCGTIIELANKSYIHHQLCSRCGFDYGKQIFLPQIDMAYGVPQDCVDIDEGQPLQ